MISLTALTKKSRFRRREALLRYVQSVERSLGVMLIMPYGDGTGRRYMFDEQAIRNACPMVFVNDGECVD